MAAASASAAADEAKFRAGHGYDPEPPLWDDSKDESDKDLSPRPEELGTESQGWLYATIIFVVVALTVTIVMLLLTSGHLTDIGSAPKEGSDNKLKSVNRNSAGTANHPRVHEQFEHEFMEGFGADSADSAHLSRSARGTAERDFVAKENVFR